MPRKVSKLPICLFCQFNFEPVNTFLQKLGRSCLRLENTLLQNFISGTHNSDKTGQICEVREIERERERERHLLYAADLMYTDKSEKVMRSY
jgi:hypothetical protein